MSSLKEERKRSLLDGVNINFDEDFDERIIPVAKALLGCVIEVWGDQPIICLGEHEGGVTIQVRRSFLRGLKIPVRKFAEWVEGEVSCLSRIFTQDCWTTFFCPEGVEMSPYCSYTVTSNEAEKLL